jgi:hypothetical protein
MLSNFDINGDGIFNGFELLSYTIIFIILYYYISKWLYNKFNFWYMPNREAYKKYWK